MFKRKKEENEKSKNMSKRALRKIKRTTQNAIDYEAMTKDGICYIGDDLYSRTISFTDINYQIAKQEDQEDIWNKYMEILNSLGSETGIQLVLHNRMIDKEDFMKDVLMESKDDDLDNDREAFNDVMRTNLAKGTNNIVTDKLFVFTTKNDRYEEAIKDLEYQSKEFQDRFNELGCHTQILDGKERLEHIYTMLHPTDKFFFDYDRVNETFTSKDAIAPSSFDFSTKDMFMAGDRYCRVLFLRNYSTELSDRFINDIVKIEHNLVVSLNMKSVPRGEEIPLIKTNIAAMEMQKMDEQRRALKEGYDPEMIPNELKVSLDEAYTLLDDVQKMNQRLFICQLFVMLNCETKEELEELTKQILTKAKAKSCEMITLNYQQENCMNACFPLGRTKVYAGAGGKGRTLTTPVVGVLIPFTSQELMQKGKHSFYYGMNPTTNNLIYANRRGMDNASGWYLAKPRSGKSFAVKREIVQILLKTNDDVIVIDPENEYDRLCKRYNGENLNIDSSKKIFLNPLEGNVKDSSFISDKSDFMQTFMSNILGYDDLDAKQKSAIDRTIRVMFASYEESLDKYEKGIESEKPHFPTLDDFAEYLNMQPEQSAKDMYEALGIYTKDGTYNIFSKTSTVNINNRFVVYGIKDLSEGLKSLAMMVILESLWDRVKKNFEIGKRTWIYIDEIYLLFYNDYCVRFFFELWKRGAKHGGILTGITQNVEDLINDEKIVTMLSNSNFIVLLDQSANDRDSLARILSLSPQMLSSITNAKKGSGLLHCGNATIPFEDRFPKDNPIYEALTSDFDEVVAIRKKQSMTS